MQSLADGLPQPPQGISPSTHVLKPDIRRLAKVRHSATNQAIVMRAPAQCGQPTVEVFYEPRTQACVVKRFHRMLRSDGGLCRLLQYHLCQLSSFTSDRKYEKDGNPDLIQCAQLIRNCSAAPAVDLKHLSGWLFFNLYTGNNDGHAKEMAVRPAFELSVAEDMTKRIPGAIETAIGSLQQTLSPGAKTLALRLQEFVLKNTRQTAKRIIAG